MHFLNILTVRSVVCSPVLVKYSPIEKAAVIILNNAQPQLWKIILANAYVETQSHEMSFVELSPVLVKQRVQRRLDTVKRHKTVCGSYAAHAPLLQIISITCPSNHSFFSL